MANFILVKRFLKTTLSANQTIKTKTENEDIGGLEFVNTNLGNAAPTGAVIRNANCSDVYIEQACYDGMRIDGILVTDLLRVYRNGDSWVFRFHKQNPGPRGTRPRFLDTARERAREGAYFLNRRGSAFQNGRRAEFHEAHYSARPTVPPDPRCKK